MRVYIVNPLPYTFVLVLPFSPLRLKSQETEHLHTVEDVCQYRLWIAFALFSSLCSVSNVTSLCASFTH